MDQIIVGGATQAGCEPLTTTTPCYNVLMGYSSPEGWNNSIDPTYVYQCMPTSGVIRNLFIKLTVDPTNGGSSYTFSLYKNGAATALTCTIAAGHTTGSDTIHSVSVAPGDLVCIQCIASATAPAATCVMWSTLFSGAIDGESICLLNIPITTPTTTYYSEIQGSNADITTEAQVQGPVPTAGVFKKMYVALSTAPGTGTNGLKISLRVAAATVNNTVSIAGAATTGNITNVTDTVAAGNLVDIRVEKVNTPTVGPWAAIGIVFVSNTNGESILMGGDSGNAVSTYTCYKGICGINKIDFYDETGSLQLMQYCKIYNLYVQLSVATGSTSKHQVVSIDKNAGAASGLTVDIHSVSGKTGNDVTHSYYPANGDTATLVCAPSGTPAASYIHTGLVCYLPPLIPKTSCYPQILVH